MNLGHSPEMQLTAGKQDCKNEKVVRKLMHSANCLISFVGTLEQQLNPVTLAKDLQNGCVQSKMQQEGPAGKMSETQGP